MKPGHVLFLLAPVLYPATAFASENHPVGWKIWIVPVISVVLLAAGWKYFSTRCRADGALFRSLVEGSLAGVAVIRGDTVVYVNPEMGAIVGYDPDEIIGSSLDRFLHGSNLATALANQSLRLSGESPPDLYELSVSHRTGRTLRVEVHAGIIQWRGKRCSVAYVRDRTERVIMQERLQEAHDELNSIFTNSQVGIMHLKGGRVLAKGNRRLADILGYTSPNEMLGLDMRALHLTEERFHEFGERYFYPLAHGSRIHVEYRLARKDGSPVWCMLSGKAVDSASPADLDRGVIWIVDDISRQKELEEELRRRASTDPLTGLNNRRRFMERAEAEMGRHHRHGHPLSLLMVDLDNFKHINDWFGHESGDRVLVAFAELCAREFREADVIGRLGGEEFAALLPDTDMQRAQSVAERLRRAVQVQEMTYGEAPVKFTVSIGVAEVGRSGESLDSLMRRADLALYRAKGKGKNRVES